MRKHARFSPSSADRWATCPRAAWLTLRGEMPASVAGTAAETGTRKHSEAEKLFLKVAAGEVPHPHETPTLTSTERRMIVSVWQTLRLLGFRAEEIELECKLRVPIRFESGEPSYQYGYADIVARSATKLAVVDHKFGQIPVEADALQLRLYAQGVYWALSRGERAQIREVYAIVNQPAAGGIKQAKLPLELIKRAVRIACPKEPLGSEALYAGKVSDKACLFCPLKTSCPEYREKEAKNIVNALDNVAFL